MMRGFMSENKKLRGKKRLFARLRGWSEGLVGRPAPEDIGEYPYWNWKLPAPIGLVEGKRAGKRLAIGCAQLLIDAADRLSRTRPAWAAGCRVVCHITTPDMFGSEVCVYMDEGHFQRQISPVSGKYETKERIAGKSLARRWRLILPEGFGEVGVRVFQPDEEDGDYRSEWWLFGDVEASHRASEALNRSKLTGLTR